MALDWDCCSAIWRLLNICERDLVSCCGVCIMLLLLVCCCWAWRGVPVDDDVEDDVEDEEEERQIRSTASSHVHMATSSG